jgi:hypothetical protein
MGIPEQGAVLRHYRERRLGACCQFSLNLLGLVSMTCDPTLG